MRKVTFTEEESTFIAKSITHNINDHKKAIEYKEGIWGIEKRYILPLERLAAKISAADIIFLGPKEVFLLHATLSFYPLKIEEKKDELFWLELSESQPQVLKDFDTRKDVLAKTGYYNIKRNAERCDVNFRFRHVLDTVAKLKAAQTILLRKNNEDIFYRIAFVHGDDGLMTFKFTEGLALAEQQFGSLYGSSSHTYATKREYTHMVSKHKALALLQENLSAGSDATRQFFLRVLSAHA